MRKKVEDYITVKKVNTISEELIFQREYYNFKCEDEEDTLEIKNYYDDRTGLALGEEIALLIENKNEIVIERNKDTNVPKKLSKEVFKQIEEPKIVKDKYNQKRNEVKTLNNYYSIMYYMFKLYGFLDDYEIFQLLNKYNIKPKNEKMEKQVEKLKEICNEEYQEKKPFRLGYYNIVFNKEYVINFCNEYNAEKYLLLGQDNIEKYENGGNPSLKLDKIRNIIKEKYSLLNDIERKTKSLDLHKPTSFLDEILNDKIDLITYDTMMNILEDLELVNTDLYYFLNKETMKKDDTPKGNKRIVKFETI